MSLSHTFTGEVRLFLLWFLRKTQSRLVRLMILMVSNSLTWRWVFIFLLVCLIFDWFWAFLDMNMQSFLLREIVGCGMWVEWNYWWMQSWWVIWILESLGFMMLPRGFWRISRYSFSLEFDIFMDKLNFFWRIRMEFISWCGTLVQLTDVPEVDCLLITQSLDDHCHLKTLKPLSEKYPTLRVIATPNAKALLDPLFSNVSVFNLNWCALL